MSVIRDYVNKNLMDPLKYYPTAIQDTMTTIIADRLEELYTLAVKFPEITTPSHDRLDILKVIADQFLFNIRDDAELQEQIDILDNIIYVYNKRGSIDTIENMWKYYGGKLPREIEVKIPTYSLFTWNISRYDKIHVFPDSLLNKPGVYEVLLNNNTYPIADLKQFMLDELVTAGTTLYFEEIKHSDILSNIPECNPYSYIVLNQIDRSIFSLVEPYYHAMTYSGDSNLGLSGRYIPDFPIDPTPEEIKEIYSRLKVEDIHARWSGKANIWIDVTHTMYLDSIIFPIDIYPLMRKLEHIITMPVMSESVNLQEIHRQIYLRVYSTPEDNTVYINQNFINRDDEKFVKREHFILGGVSKLGIINYEKVED